MPVDDPDVVFTLTPQQATDVINNVPRVDAGDEGIMPTVFYILYEQYQAQGGGQ